MKKVILIVTLFFIGFLSHGQFFDRINFEYGLTKSILEWDSHSDNKYEQYDFYGQEGILGFFSSIEVDYFTLKFFSISSTLGYYEKGAYDSFKIMRDLKWKLNYCTFDTKAKLKYPINKFEPFISCGPRVDYLVSFSSEFDEIDRVAEIHKVNFGLRYSVGLDYNLERMTIGISCKNNYNFNSIIENNGELMLPGFSIYDKTMIYNLRFGFKI